MKRVAVDGLMETASNPEAMKEELKKTLPESEHFIIGQKPTPPDSVPYPDIEISRAELDELEQGISENPLPDELKKGLSEAQ